MSTSTAAITNASINATLTPAVVTPVTGPAQVTCPITCANVTYLNTFEGSFTPSNNNLTVFAPSGLSQSPNYLVVIVDQPMSLTLTNATRSFVNSMPIQKCALITLPALTSPITAITLDGTTADQLSGAVQQGVQCNYFIGLGVCTVS